MCRHCFEVATENATYFMFAQTDKEKDEWIGAIGRWVQTTQALEHILR